MDIKVQNVTISPSEIREVIASLEDAIKRNQELKTLCERILRVQGEPVGARGRGRRPKGVKTLRQVIVEVLEKSSEPLGAGALRDRVLKAGYETTATRQSFYTAVYNTATKEPSIKKTGAGFQLRRGGAKKAAGGRKKKARAKRAKAKR